MTSRERMSAILAGEAPDRVALFEHFWPETIGGYWRQQGFPADRGPHEVFDYDLVGLGWDVDTTPFRGVNEVMEETDRHILTRNGRGAVLRHWKGKSGTPEHVGFECVTPEVWREKYREPMLDLDLSRIDTEGLPKRLEQWRQSDKYLVYGNLFIFELMRATLGDVVMLESMVLEPDWIRDFCQVHLDFFIAHYTWIFDHIGKPDGMFIYEDLGFSNGPFCSPQTYMTLIRPYHTALVRFFHDYDLPVILHTCGDVRQIFDQLVASGWNCLQPMEAKAGNHVLDYADQAAEMRRPIGFMGNIDVTKLNTNNKDIVAAEVLPKIEGMKARRAGYCFHSDHSIPPDVEYETYRFAVDLVREHGEYN